MSFEPRYMIYAAVIVGMVMLFEGMRQAFFNDDQDDNQKLRRLRALSGTDQIEQAMNKLRRKVEKPRWAHIPILGTLPANMAQAGITTKPRVFLAVLTFGTVLTFFVALKLTGPLIAIAIALVVGVVAPVAYINIRRTRRVEAFAVQLPDALDQMKRGLAVGHPVNTTIRAVATSMKDPVASEFQRMADQVVYGDTLPDAVDDMARRMDVEDAYYLAASIRIQHGTGGNLGAMLGTLSTVIRSRFAMRRRIKAVSSEGRISALLLSCLPFLMFGGTLITAPDYYSSVSDDPKFYPMCAMIVFFVVGNGLILRKLVNFRY